MLGLFVRWGCWPLVLALSACSPSYNWREVGVPNAPLKGVLPCKPETTTRDMVLGSATVPMTWIGCEAGGQTFTLARLSVTPAIGQTPQAMQAMWRQAQLQTWQALGPRPAASSPGSGAADTAAGGAQVSPFAVRRTTPGEAQTVLAGERVVARGRTPQGQPLLAQMVLVTQGADVYQAMWLTLDTKAQASVADEFFAGLSLP